MLTLISDLSLFMGGAMIGAISLLLFACWPGQTYDPLENYRREDDSYGR